MPRRVKYFSNREIGLENFDKSSSHFFISSSSLYRCEKSLVEWSPTRYEIASISTGRFSLMMSSRAFYVAI